MFDKRGGRIMGADGSIRIYDRQKLEDKYNKEILESFFDYFLSSTMYCHELSGKKYITRYCGDNIWATDDYDTFLGSYSIENDNFNDSHWSYSKYAADYFRGLPKFQRQTFYEMISFLENECYITTWEVWT